MKKCIIFLLVFIIAAISGCAQEEIPEDAIWDRNPGEHWINGENGEKLHIGEHELDEENFCTVCKSFVEYQTDGSTDVCNYDEKYNLTRSTSFDSEGNILFDYVMEYKYNEKNAISYEATYQNGRLYEETEYLEDEIIKNFYEEDGSHSIEIYRKDISEIDEGRSYDAEGNLLYEHFNQNFITDEGSVYLTRVTDIHYFIEIKQIREFNAIGDEISCKSYNLGDELLSSYDYIYEYGEENIINYQKTLFNGNLESENFFDIITENGELLSQLKKTITYYENGSKLVREFDKNGNEISAINYDANGNVIE